MTRPDLGDSDLQGLDATYRKRCDPRWWEAQEEIRAIRQTMQRDNRTAKRLREPPRNPWTLLVRWLAVLVAGPGLWALLIWLAWGRSWI